jgi:hypothetical protein
MSLSSSQSATYTEAETENNKCLATFYCKYAKY